jgi:hypothetical protein
MVEAAVIKPALEPMCDSKTKVQRPVVPTVAQSNTFGVA